MERALSLADLNPEVTILATFHLLVKKFYTTVSRNIHCTSSSILAWSNDTCCESLFRSTPYRHHWLVPFLSFMLTLLLLVSAGTGFVGLRIPSHPIARQLLETSSLPIAAPSANRFGHVSPTRAEHVIDDLGESDIAVIDGGTTYILFSGYFSTFLFLIPPI